MNILPFNMSQKSNSGSYIDYQHSAETQSTIGLTPEITVQALQAQQTMKIVKFISYSLMCMTAVLGTFILMSAYVQAGARCDCSRYHASESRNSPYYEPLTALSSEDTADEIRKLPVRIQLEGEAGDLLKSGKRGRINCEVERKTATQIIASEPKMLITPYGNMTTDPRLIHMTGEKMFFSCSTGKGSQKDKKNKSNLATILKLDKPMEEPESKEEKTDGKSTPSPSRPKREIKTKDCSCHCS
ncbi:msr-110 [Brevipalpus obovatus]|uniref:msr-110 n=1 Tax=Brevipalpus obovatus TaxID=246614 RepID=UPI003D9E1263